MDLWNRPLSRLLCAEPLEGRWLLSAAAAPSTDAGITDESAGVRVVLLEPDDEDEDDADVEIAASQLPADVVAALGARFPGATIIEAELDEEEGVEYGVTAAFAGKTLEITFSETGRVLETEEILTSADLPPAVHAWLDQEFPGAQVDEAAIVARSDTTTYELSFVAPGQQAMEAVLTVQSPPAPEPQTASQSPPQLAAFSTAAIVDPSVEIEPTITSEPASAGDASAQPGTAEQADATTTDAEDRRDEAGSYPEWLSQTGQARVAEALASLAAGAAATAWLPEVAGAIDDVLPLNVAAVEARLRQVLAEIDKLAQQALTDATPAGAAMRLAIVVALLGGVQLLMLDRKLRKGGPVRIFSAADSSWSWMVGTVIPVRVRRANVFRK